MMSAPEWTFGPEQPGLAENQAHIWRIELNRDAGAFEALLTADEAQRAGRFHFEKDRRQFAITRGALRTLLSRYLQRPAGTFRFALGKNGKPFLPGERLRFSVAHSNGLALIAFALDVEIGVDLEDIRRRVPTESVASAVLSWRELAAWQALPESGQRAAFFDHWVAKEACLKAWGTGFSRDPRTMETDEAPVQRIDVGEGFAAAFAVWSGTAFSLSRFAF